MKLIVIRDSREHEGQGYLLNAVTMALKASDYTLAKSIEDDIQTLELSLVAVERKRNGSELAQNLGAFRSRFLREMEKIRHTKYKFLVIEDSLEGVLNPAFSNLNSEFILCSIIDICLEYGIMPIFAGDAHHGEKFTTTLLNRIIKKSSDDLGGLTELQFENKNPDMKGSHHGKQ